MTKSWKAIAELGDRWWIVTVPELGRGTQARTTDEIEPMAADLITAMTDEPHPCVEVEIRLPDDIRAALDEVARARTIEAEQRRLAADQLRLAARKLRAHRLPLRDIGSVLGVSHQRASQLVSDRDRKVA
ncbi:MAG: hypothetical protein ABF811_04215 [Pseudoclavibacter sp.]